MRLSSNYIIEILCLLKSLLHLFGFSLLHSLLFRRWVYKGVTLALIIPALNAVSRLRLFFNAHILPVAVIPADFLLRRHVLASFLHFEHKAAEFFCCLDLS